MAWIVVVAVIALSLLPLAVALLRTWRAAKRLASAVGRAGESFAVLDELAVTRPAVAASAASTEQQLRAREAALVEREAELLRREALVGAAPRGRNASQGSSRSWGAPS